MSVTRCQSKITKSSSALSIRRVNGASRSTAITAGAPSRFPEAPDAIRFCSRCGSRVEMQIPLHDHLPRHVCPACSTVQYRNPRIIVGFIPETDDGRIVMCRRAIPPRQGFWTFPAGHLENGETGEQGAIREAAEEAGIRAQAHGLYMVVHVLAAQEVHLIYRGRVSTPTFAPGPESSEVRLVGESDMPWDELAFPTIGTCLRRYFTDRTNGRFPVHTIDVIDEGAMQGDGAVEPWTRILSSPRIARMPLHVD